jgi:hypothetical protein
MTPFNGNNSITANNVLTGLHAAINYLWQLQTAGTKSAELQTPPNGGTKKYN